MNELGIVLKITERCNLNCSYCYYFNGVDSSFKSMPPRITQNVVDEICSFLSKGIKDLSLKKIIIGFHGGEPLLLGKKEFVLVCTKFIEELSPLCKLEFNIQTNGTLIDIEWIKIFQKFHIDVGLSIDGPQEYHDQYRVDHFGNGSYNRILKNIDLLNKNFSQGFGALSVINSTRNARKIYRHFVDELKIKSFDLLFPDFHYSNNKTINAKAYGKFICDVFDEWVKDDNPTIKVRFLNSYLQLFLGGDSLIYGIGSEKHLSLPLISIRSNGNLSPTDELMSTHPETVTYTGCNVFDTSLKKFLQHNIFKEISFAQQNLPEECKNCCWSNVCGGGGITNRFSIKNRFDNPSIYCEGLKLFYSKVLKYLLESGIPLKQLKKQLIG